MPIKTNQEALMSNRAFPEGMRETWCQLRQVGLIEYELEIHTLSAEEILK